MENGLTNGRSKITNGLSNGVHAKALPERTLWRVFFLSAADKGSIKLLIARFASYLTRKGSEKDELLNDLAFTLSMRRSLLEWGVAVPARTPEELMASIQSEDLEPIRRSKQPQISFVFTGQGAQWHAMGRELMINYSVFRSTIQEAEICLTNLGANWSLIGSRFFTLG